MRACALVFICLKDTQTVLEEALIRHWKRYLIRTSSKFQPPMPNLRSWNCIGVNFYLGAFFSVYPFTVRDQLTEQTTIHVFISKSKKRISMLHRIGTKLGKKMWWQTEIKKQRRNRKKKSWEEEAPSGLWIRDEKQRGNLGLSLYKHASLSKSHRNWDTNKTKSLYIPLCV